MPRAVWMRVSGAIVAGFFITTGAFADERVVAVSGRGEVSAMPDRAQVTMAVEVRRPDVSTGRREVDLTVQRVLAVCDDLGIPKAQLRTTSVTIRPQYEWDRGTQERRLTGYVVSRGIELELRRLDELGTLIARVTDAGVNQVMPPRLESSREDALRREALEAAARDARANADALARTLDAGLGPVRRISTADLNVTPPPIREHVAVRAMSADSPGAPETYTPGKIEFTARVVAEFDLVVK